MHNPQKCKIFTPMYFLLGVHVELRRLVSEILWWLSKCFSRVSEILWWLSKCFSRVTEIPWWLSNYCENFLSQRSVFDSPRSFHPFHMGFFNWAISESWWSPCEMGESSMVSQKTDLCVRKLTQYELPKVRIKPSHSDFQNIFHDIDICRILSCLC